MTGSINIPSFMALLFLSNHCMLLCFKQDDFWLSHCIFAILAAAKT
jgi:hypothetical protein